MSLSSLSKSVSNAFRSVALAAALPILSARAAAIAPAVNTQDFHEQKETMLLAQGAARAADTFPAFWANHLASLAGLDVEFPSYGRVEFAEQALESARLAMMVTPIHRASFNKSSDGITNDNRVAPAPSAALGF